MLRQYGSGRIRQVTFEVDPDRGDPDLTSRNDAVTQTLRITPGHPALIFGVAVDEPKQDEPGSHPSAENLRLLAEHAEPSLQSIIHVWIEYCAQSEQRSRIPNLLQFPPWLMIFGLLITPTTVTVVAHHPRSASIQDYQWKPELTSTVLDTIPFHSSIHYLRAKRDWSTSISKEDESWVEDRFKIFIMLQTLLKNSRIISGYWDDTRRGYECLEKEEELEKLHAEWTLPTPTPSEDRWQRFRDRYGDEVAEAYRAKWRLYESESDEEEDRGATESADDDEAWLARRIAWSKHIVGKWVQGIDGNFMEMPKWTFDPVSGLYQ